MRVIETKKSGGALVGSVHMVEEAKQKSNYVSAVFLEGHHFQAQGARIQVKPGRAYTFVNDQGFEIQPDSILIVETRNGMQLVMAEEINVPEENLKFDLSLLKPIVAVVDYVENEKMVVQYNMDKLVARDIWLVLDGVFPWIAAAYVGE
jgi:hypothetical protein